MSSSHKPIHPLAEPPQALLVREAGLPYRPAGARDPFEAWLGLMEVVEALCTRWPARERSAYATLFRL